MGISQFQSYVVFHLKSISRLYLHCGDSAAMKAVSQDQVEANGIQSFTAKRLSSDTVVVVGSKKSLEASSEKKSSRRCHWTVKQQLLRHCNRVNSEVCS